jgi:membrane protein DedA with SNARE-associated domain
MPSLQQIFAWLLALPDVMLAGAGFALAFVENLVPPLPSDSLIGFIAFIAAAGDAPIGPTMGAIISGSVCGAALMYVLGRRYGADGLHARLQARGLLQQEQRLERMYERYGLVALFVGRLIPGVRSVVPMVAGAMRLNAWVSLAVVALATSLWYGTLTYVAYRVGGSWEAYSAQLRAIGQWSVAIGGGIALTVSGVLVWLWHRTRRPR